MRPVWAERPSMGERSLRVAYVLKKFPRLSETFVLDEILGLEAAGVDVSILSLRQPDEGRFQRELADVRAAVTYLPPFGSAAAMDAFGALAAARHRDALPAALAFLERLPAERRAHLLVQALEVSRVAVAGGVDHLHAHFMTVAAQTAYLAHLFSGIPFSVTAHAKDVYRDAVDPAVFRTLAGAASAVVTVCDANRDYIATRLAPGARVVRIYNGVDLERLRPRRVALEPGLIVAAGRLVEKKGFDVLLQAAALLAGRGRAFSCVVIGDGEERERLLAQAGRLRLDGAVRFVGAATREQVLSWMARARVVGAPYVTGEDGNRDALPTVLLEALALGVPVVTTAVGGVEEIVEDGAEGLVVPEGDAAALADALERVLRDDALSLRFGAAGRRKAELRFDRRESVPALIELFAGSAAARAPAMAVG